MMNARLSELPYHASVWEVEDLLGHGTIERKLVNADRILASEEFDNVYKLIVSVHKQNIKLQQMLDTPEDRDVPAPPKKIVRKRAPPKKAAPKRVAVTALPVPWAPTEGGDEPETQPPPPRLET